jgi:hypothetical protein
MEEQHDYTLFVQEDGRWKVQKQEKSYLADLNGCSCSCRHYFKCGYSCLTVNVRRTFVF